MPGSELIQKWYFTIVNDHDQRGICQKASFKNFIHFVNLFFNLSQEDIRRTIGF